MVCAFGGRESRADGPSGCVSYSCLVGGPSLVSIPGLDTVQLQMARSIDNVCPTINGITTTAAQQLAAVCNAMTGTAVKLQGGSNPAGLPAISGLSLTGLANALTQINGGAELVVPTNQASILRGVQAGAVGSRLSILHMRMMGGGPADDSATRFAVNDATDAQDSSPRVQLTQNGPSNVSLWSGKLGAFVNVLGQFGSSDTTGSQNGYSFNNEGFLAGVDYQFTPSFVAGVAFGYTYSDTDFDSSPQSPPGQFLHSNLFQGNLYSTIYATDALYLDGVISIGGGNNNSSRTIVVPGLPFSGSTATGSFNTTTYGLSLGGGYNIPMGTLTLTPTARFEYHRIATSAYGESGAAALDLNYGSSTAKAVLSFLGGQASYAISTGFGVITPTVRANWAHQYNSGDTGVSVKYSADPTGLSAFTLVGDSPVKDYFDLGVGAAMQLAGSLSGFVNYDAILGLSHTSFNSFTGGVRYAF